MDAIKEVRYYTKFQDTVKGIFKFYFYSPKKRRELLQISEILQEDRVRYGGLKAIRWVASQHRALMALQKHYAVTVYHLENTTNSKGEDGAKAKGLSKELKKERFVKLLHFMIDVTAILGQLSKQFQYEDLFITDVITKVEKAKLLLEDLKDGGKCYTSFCDNYDTQSNTIKCGKNGEQMVKLQNPGVNMEECFHSLLSNICKYIDQRFQSLNSSPISCFQIFNFRLWPTNRADLLRHGDDITTLVDHFSNVLPDEMTAASVLDQWLDLKLLLSQPAQRKLRPQQFYSSLLASNSDNLSSILSIVEVMMVLSVSTAVCETSFSTMNRIKTSLKTNMTQEVLQDLMMVSTTSASIKDFSPQEAISIWISSGQRKRHFTTAQKPTSTSTSTAQPQPPAAAPTDDQVELPPLPALDSDNDSE